MKTALDVVITPRAGRADLLRAAAADRGWRVHETPGFSSPDTDRYRRSAARSGRGLLIVHYPIETTADVETVLAFAACLPESGGLLHVPRPNAHVVVADPALLGTLKPGDGISSTTRRLFGLIRSRPTSTAFATGVTAPPSSMQPVWSGISWSEWTPPAETTRRDLLDRVDRFFPAPRGIHLAVINQCNLRCGVCPYHSPLYRARHASGYFETRRAMSDEVFETVADYAAERGAALQFGQIEEALMHRRTLDFIASAKRRGVSHVHLTTNGTLLTAERAERLAASGIDSVMFSLDATTPESYREARGGDLGEVEANIVRFSKLAAGTGVRIGASFIMRPTATGEREAFLARWRDAGMDYVTFYALTSHDPETGRVSGKKALYEREARYPCSAPWTQMVVFPEGKVSLCCQTMVEVGWRGVVEVGDVSRSDPDVVWTGEAYRRVRSELLDGRFEEFDVCAGCDIWSAGTARSERGDGYRRDYNETSETFSFDRSAP